MRDRILPDGTLVLPVYHDLLTTTDEMLEAAALEIEEYRPNLLYVDAVHLSWLVRFLRRQGRIIKLPDPCGIVLSYGFATSRQRDAIAGYFGARVPMPSVMAMSEFGYVGIECHKGVMHLNTTDFFLEFVPLDGANDSASELVVTTIGEKLSPKIRYRTGDLYRIRESQCECRTSCPGVVWSSLLFAGKSLTGCD